MDTFDENIPDYGSIYRTRRKGGVMNNLHLAYHNYFHGSGGGYDLNKDTDNQTSTEKEKNEAEETLEGGEELDDVILREEREFLQTPAKESKTPAKTPAKDGGKSKAKDMDEVKRRIKLTTAKKGYQTPASQPHNSRKHMLSPEPVNMKPKEPEKKQEPKHSKIGPGMSKNVARKSSVIQENPKEVANAPKTPITQMTKEEFWKEFEKDDQYSSLQKL